MRIAASLLLLAATVLAKPLTIDVVEEVREAWLIAEVEVLEVEPPTTDRKKKPNTVRVRVTADPTGIFKGHHMLGEELELRIPPNGAIRCYAQLSMRRGEETPYLIVAKKDRTLVLGGYVAKDGYRLRGWFDFNDCRLRCDDPALGGTIEKGPHQGRFLLHRDALAGIHRDEGRAFWKEVALFLTKEMTEPEEKELHFLVRLLSSGSTKERDYAQQVLVEDAGLHVLYLRRALDLARDPEARRRLKVVLERLKLHSQASNVAQRLTEEGKIHVAREGAHLLSGNDREEVERWLAKREKPG